MESRSDSMDMLNFANGLGRGARGSASGAGVATRGCGTWAWSAGAIARRPASTPARTGRAREALRHDGVAEGRLIVPWDDGTGGVCAGYGCARHLTGPQRRQADRTCRQRRGQPFGFSTAAPNNDACVAARVTSARRSADVEQLVRLQPESPLRMCEAVCESGLRIGARRHVVAGIEWLQDELGEVEPGVARGIPIGM